MRFVYVVAVVLMFVPCLLRVACLIEVWRIAVRCFVSRVRCLSIVVRRVLFHVVLVCYVRCLCALLVLRCMMFVVCGSCCVLCCLTLVRVVSCLLLFVVWQVWLVVRCVVLVVSCVLCVVGCRLLVGFYWLLFAVCCLLLVCCLLCVVRWVRLLLVVICSLCVVCCWLFVVGCRAFFCYWCLLVGLVIVVYHALCLSFAIVCVCSVVRSLGGECCSSCGFGGRCVLFFVRSVLFVVCGC